MSEHDTTRDGCPEHLSCHACESARRVRTRRDASFVWAVCMNGSTVISGPVPRNRVVEAVTPI